MLSVLKGALVRILVDGAYQLRLVVSTKLDGKQLQLLLNVGGEGLCATSWPAQSRSATCPRHA